MLARSATCTSRSQFDPGNTITAAFTANAYSDGGGWLRRSYARAAGDTSEQSAIPAQAASQVGVAANLSIMKSIKALTFTVRWR